MKKVELIQKDHNVKTGDKCGHKKPNITEDTLFIFEGEIIGFYLKDISEHSEKLSKLIAIANKELRSKNVPKSVMSRTSGMNNEGNEVKQYSTIIGSIPSNPRVGRNYPGISSVHDKPSAKTFIKAMLLSCQESENLIKKIAPKIYERQIKLIEENVPKKFRFSKMFTSSISNYNICAPFHTDRRNIKGCVNVIIAKKQNATGGNTTVPDYDATVDSSDNSMLVYPAWRNLHGVTPIVPTHKDGS